MSARADKTAHMLTDTFLVGDRVVLVGRPGIPGTVTEVERDVASRCWWVSVRWDRHTAHVFHYHHEALRLTGGE